MINNDSSVRICGELAHRRASTEPASCETLRQTMDQAQGAQSDAQASEEC